MSSNTIYCTYLTTYSGNKLPPFYIGSTSIDKINCGYRGSVLSKKYKSIWKYELKHYPHLFNTRIISIHNTRKAAIEKELTLQKALNVVKSVMYINMSYACVNGYFGAPMKGIEKSQRMKNKLKGNTNAKGLKGYKQSREHKLKKSIAMSGKIRSLEHSKAISDAKKGIPQSCEMRTKVSESMKGRKWWHNSNNETRFSIECPGDEWLPGRS